MSNELPIAMFTKITENRDVWGEIQVDPSLILKPPLFHNIYISYLLQLRDKENYWESSRAGTILPKLHFDKKLKQDLMKI